MNSDKHSAAEPQGGAANLGCSRLSSRLVGIARPGRSRLESRLGQDCPPHNSPWLISYTGRTVEEEVLGKAYDARIMRRLLAYMKPYRGTVLVSLVLLLFNSLLQILGP